MNLASLQGYLQDLLVGRFRPLVLLLDEGLRLEQEAFCPLQWLKDGGGSDVLDLQAWPFQGLHTGDYAGDLCTFLLDRQPSQVLEPEVIEFLEFAPGRAAHMHLLPREAGFMVLVVDATQEYRQRQSIQQQANELDLAHRRQQQLLQALQQSHQETQQALEESTADAATKSRFIAGMSHEFRLPLASVLGHTASAWDARKTSQGLQRHLDAANAAANHLLSLVGNVLDQAQLEAGSLALNPGAVNLADLVNQLRLMFAPLVEEKGQQLTLVLGEEVPADVWLDELRLRQILINLLGNAVKYAQAGSLRLSLSCEADRHLCFELCDSGPGIDPGLRPRLFQPFERRGEPGTVGSGLGLSVSLGLAQRMGGDLRLLDRQLPGSCFRLTLPLCMPEGEASSVRGGEPRLCLLVEDDADLSAIAALWLEKAGYLVRTFADGSSVLAWLGGDDWRSESSHAPVAVVDLGLPDVPGEAVIRSLNASGFLVLAMSAANSAKEQDGAISAGARAFVDKPLEPKRLLHRLDSLLST